MSNHSTPNSKIEQLVEKLRSSNRSVREQTKIYLTLSGSKAIAPLLDLLLDLAINRHPRFQIGEEEKGEAMVAKYCEIMKQEGIYSNKLDALSDKLDDLAINDRLARDIIFLLGKLKAEAAVPLLIKRMEYLAISGYGNYYTEEKIALESIGSSAIPYLIKSITEAESRVRAEAIEDLPFNYWISWEQVDQEQFESISSSDSENDLDPDEFARAESDFQMEKDFIQFSALIVLRMMKARQAIPDLEKILSTTTDKHLIYQIEEAITRIKSPLPEGAIQEG
jgi:HEAT repeat protein